MYERERALRIPPAIVVAVLVAGPALGFLACGKDHGHGMCAVGGGPASPGAGGSTESTSSCLGGSTGHGTYVN
ncbi:MAG TPA: hypothetical protein VHB21_11345 [Minicystis sp.]|nr:hypothetical protein [Minicystis sp.]